MIVTLPIDIFLAIFSHLDLADILNIRQTCKAVAQITRFRSVWHLQLTQKVIDNGIPVPGLSQTTLESLDAQELEQFVYRAVRLRRRWSSPPEKARCRRIDFGDGQITQLRFLQSHGYSYLVALRKENPRQRLWEASCWDVQTDTPTCVARRSFRVSATFAFQFNADSTSPIVLAVQDGDKVELVGLTSGDTSKAFVTLATHPSKNRKVRHLCGTNLISVDEYERAFFWNEDCDIELRDSCNENVRGHDVRGYLVVQDRYLLICRVRELLLYVLPLEHLRKGQHSIYPVALHKWQWAIDSICLTPQIPRKSERAGRLPLINILLRFGSFLPWPINLLHYVVLEPNPCYNGAEDATISNANRPYLFPPHLKRTIAAPLLLFSSSYMTLGLYGTALWIDDHVEEHYSAETRGQRVAGLFCPKLLEEADGTDELDEWKTSTMAATVYAVQKGEVWSRLAMDEEEGRIAVGCSDGRVLINDYA